MSKFPKSGYSAFNHVNELCGLIIMLAVNTFLVSHPSTLVKLSCYGEATFLTERISRY